jgi:hypothetical protein
MLKDQLDDVLVKIHQAGMDSKSVYVLGVQVRLVVYYFRRSPNMKITMYYLYIDVFERSLPLSHGETGGVPPLPPKNVLSAAGI